MARILLVEPHRVVRVGLQLLIEQHQDWAVVGEAADGRSAVELYGRLLPDIVVTEALLPRLSGVDVTREIVRSSSCDEARVLILSAQSRQSLVQSALRVGARGYVTKGSSAKDLIEAIEVVLEGGSYLSPDVTQHVVQALTGDGDASRGLSGLTAREREVLQLITEGMSSKEIGNEVGVSLRTVESYRASLMDKLGIHKVSSLVRYAIREGLVEA